MPASPDPSRVIRLDEHGREREFELLDVVSMDGRRYGLLEHWDLADPYGDHYLAMRVVQTAEGDRLAPIDDPAEVERVIAAAREHRAGIESGVAGFPTRFEPAQVRKLFNAGVTAAAADSYPARFTSHHVVELGEAGISGAQAAEYPSRFTSWDLRNAVRSGISPSEAALYPEHHRGSDMARLAEAGVSAQQAAQYVPRFDSVDVVQLVAAGVSPETAAAYPAHVPGYTIATLARGGVEPDHVPPAPEPDHNPPAGRANQIGVVGWQPPEIGSVEDLVVDVSCRPPRPLPGAQVVWTVRVRNPRPYPVEAEFPDSRQEDVHLMVSSQQGAYTWATGAVSCAFTHEWFEPGQVRSLDCVERALPVLPGVYRLIASFGVESTPRAFFVRSPSGPQPWVPGVPGEPGVDVSEGTAISTARLFLDALCEADAQEMVEVLGDERLHEFIGDEPLDLADLRDRYALLAQGSGRPEEIWLNWIIRTRTDHRAVGTMQATVTAGNGTRAATIAWVVGVPHQGHGFASEAATALVEWLRVHDVDRIEAHVHPDHAASAAVAARAGLTPTAEYVDGETVWLLEV